MKSSKKTIALISKIIYLFNFIMNALFIYVLYTTKMIPDKYLYLLIGVLAVLFLIHSLFIFKKKTKAWVLVVLDILGLILIVFEAFGYFKINEAIDFLNNNLGAKYETNVYNLVVNSASSYNKKEDIKGKDVYLARDMDNMTDVEESLNRLVKVNIKYNEEGVIKLLNSVQEDTNMIILVNSGNYDAMVENTEGYEEKVRIIDTVTVKTRIENGETGIDVTKDPFLIYISGIDTRSGKMPSRSLSDVNIVMAVNPNTHKVLMVHVPRDYYVQVSGTTGLKDKLTHSGAIGGVNLTMKTLDEILDIDIKYYVRVNFNAVINLVDTLGGLTVNNDQSYGFRCYTDNGCYIKPGENKLNGRCTLAFARERYAYKEGDKHRGENQEQIISLLIDKISSSKTILSNYSNILKALDGTFESNITTDEMAKLINMQLDDMPKWTIETANLDGTSAKAYTASYAHQELYVMIPNQESIDNARIKLDQVLEGE